MALASEELAGAPPEPGRPSALSSRRWRYAFLAVIALAIAVRLLYLLATPDQVLVHDARDYDRHAQSIASGQGFSYAVVPGRPTAFRPPAYPVFLAGVYRLAGVEDAPVEERTRAARIAGIGVGAAIVALVGLLALQLFGSRAIALIAAAGAALYLPLVLVGGAVMSEPLFTTLMLGSLTVVLSPMRPGRRAALAGLLAGLMILTRANALILLLPLALLARARKGPGPFLARWQHPAVLVVVALLTVAPWTIRNAVVFDTFIPVSTQLGSALAGTYNETSRLDEEQPWSWRSRKYVPQYAAIYRDVSNKPEPVVERELRRAVKDYIADHPTYPLAVAYWSTRRMLDTTGRRWWRHTASTISVPRGWADAGVYCFWLFAALALAGAFTQTVRRAPKPVLAVPVLLYLSVVFLVVETPRYRSGIDPFIVLLAAAALWRIASRDAAHRDLQDL